MNSDLDREELIAESVRHKFYLKRLQQHPNCMDPDHPGCDKCEPTDEEE